MKISRGYILIFLVAFANQVLSQTRFNKVIPTSTGDIGMFIQQIGDNYEVVSAQGNGTGTFAYKKYELDSLGEVIDSTSLITGDRMDGSVYFIKNNYVISGYKDSVQGVNRSKPFFVFLDNSGDSLWTYHDTQALGIGRFYEAAYDGDNGVYVCGYIDDLGLNQTFKGILIKFDTLGNLLWRKVYSTTTGEDRFLNIKIHNNQLYISGSSTSGPYGNYDVLLAKLDSSGNKLWCNYWGGAYVDYAGLQIVNDTAVQLFGAKVNGVNDASIYMVRADTSGNTKWEYTKYFNFWGDDVAVDFVQLPNSDMIVFAYHVDPDFNDKQVGMLIKLDSSRNILWTRKYNIRPTHHQSWKLDATTDGGFVFVGSAHAVIGTFQDTWIVKVDSMGCEVPLCYLGESEFGQTVPILKVYPNPTNSVSIIELLENSREIQLYNSAGILLEKFEIFNKQKSFNLDLSFFPHDIYILRLLDKNGTTIGQGKVIKN